MKKRRLLLKVRRVIFVIGGVALAIYAVWDRVEARRLSRALDAIHARGEPTRLGARLPAPRTAEQREAATLYAAAADAALDEDDNGRASRLDVDKPGGAELSLDEIRALYRDHAPAMQLLDRATPLDFGGFEAEQRDSDSFAPWNVERGLATLASIACLRADLASLGGDGDAAVRALVPCMRLKRTVTYAQHRAAIADRILGSVRILFRHTKPSDAAVGSLQHALESWPDVDLTAGDMMRDRARFIEMSRTPFYPGLVFTVGRVVLHPFLLRSERRALHSFEGAIEVAQRPWPDRWTALVKAQHSLLERLRQHPPTLLDRLEDPYGAIVPFSQYLLWQSAHELAARRLVAAALAVERYRRAHGGSPPASIAASEDPFSGRPLIYKKEAGAYVIYSIDMNGMDDGGILYGFGAAGLRAVGQQTPRDYGIRVPTTIAASGGRGSPGR